MDTARSHKSYHPTCVNPLLNCIQKTIYSEAQSTCSDTASEKVNTNILTIPCPRVVQSLRETFYPPLAEIANAWMDQLGTTIRYPSTHYELLDYCHSNRQSRPTPLLLRWEEGGFNTLHQDLYGEIYFPFQIVIVLTQTGVDHHGGEFVLTEQIPRAQSKAIVAQPNCGDAFIHYEL